LTTRRSSNSVNWRTRARNEEHRLKKAESGFHMFPLGTEFQFISVVKCAYLRKEYKSWQYSYRPKSERNAARNSSLLIRWKIM
jgi:hypothetical protein